jgi:hypothetical protein
MSLRVCINDFEMVPVASIATGITFALKFHMLNFNYKVLYFKNFSAPYLIIFLSPEISTSINMLSFFIFLDYDLPFI